jgi:hypothetical protein
MNDKYNSNTIEFQYKILRYLQNEAKNNPTIFVERHSSDLDKVSRARTESITSWKVFDGMERVSLIPEIPKTFPIGIPKVDLNKWTAQQKHSLTVLGAADLLFYSKEIDEIKAGTDDETLSQAIKTYLDETSPPEKAVKDIFSAREISALKNIISHKIKNPGQHQKIILIYGDLHDFEKYSNSQIKIKKVN